MFQSYFSAADQSIGCGAEIFLLCVFGTMFRGLDQATEMQNFYLLRQHRWVFRAIPGSKARSDQNSQAAVY
jgi:hypothetical protein